MAVTLTPEVLAFALRIIPTPSTPLDTGQAVTVARLLGSTSTTTTALGWRLHPAFTAGGAAFLVGAARPFVA